MLGAAGVTAGAVMATGLRTGDFGVADALRLARDVRRKPLLLTLDLTTPLRPEGGGLAALRARGRPTLRETIETVVRAADDERVVGLICRVGRAVGGVATVQELAGAVRVFAASGKPAIAHAEDFFEGANGTLPFLLATAFGEIHMQPSGDLGLVGFAAEVTFLRGTLDKLGIDPQFEHRHEYKNAADTLTEHSFTPAHREAIESVVDAWSSQIVEQIAAARRLDPAAVRSAIDDSPLGAQEALDRGLIDALAYRDEALTVLRDRVPGDAELTPLAEYRTAVLPRWHWRSRRGPMVAVIDARGAIRQGRRTGGFGGAGISSDTLGAALRQAAQDSDVAAVVLRVDSGGGSAVASDVIRREIHRARRAGTPVVTWLGDVAASGGYYIAMAADQIVAQPGTLTGSIGVVSGKAVTAELQDKLGLHTEAVSRGEHARIFSSATPFSESERERLDALLDRVYDDFTSKVAHDRGLTQPQVHEVAKGRIWTGAQAHDRGLVDRLGGYPEVLAAVRAALKLRDDASLRVHRYPPPPPLTARLRGKEQPDPAEEQVAALLALSSADPSQIIDVLARAVAPAGALTAPFLPRLR